MSQSTMTAQSCIAEGQLLDALPGVPRYGSGDTEVSELESRMLDTHSNMASPDSPRPVEPGDLEGDLVRPENPLFGTVWINQARMSGAPCFYGTRVPVKHLFDYVRAGHTVAEFLDDFPGVTPEQVESVLRRAADFVLPKGHAA